MPYLIMTISVIIVIAAIVLPVKWILETDAASKHEKAIFILLVIPLSIFSYYLFYAYLKYVKQQ